MEILIQPVEIKPQDCDDDAGGIFCPNNYCPRLDPWCPVLLLYP